MTERKALSTLAVATLTTGTCMVEGFAGVYEAAEWLMGYPVWTHELGAASDRIREIVKAQRPDFPTDQDLPDWRTVRDDVLDRFGPEVEFERGGEVKAAGPVETLRDAMKGKPS